MGILAEARKLLESSDSEGAPLYSDVRTDLKDLSSYLQGLERKAEDADRPIPEERVAALGNKLRAVYQVVANNNNSPEAIRILIAGIGDIENFIKENSS